MNDFYFTMLVNLAQTLHHENTHNQHQERYNKEISGSDENMKKCFSLWTEIEAYDAEILFKLNLELLLRQNGQDTKADALQDLIDALLKQIETLTEWVETIGGEVAKKVESTDCSPTINKVCEHVPITVEELQKLIDAVQQRENNATEKRKELGVAMQNQRKESESKEINPNTGGFPCTS